jgi:hypothetical protein
MNWKLLYDAIWKDREIPRVESIIDKRRRDDTSFYSASSLVRNLFQTIYLTLDFFLEDIMNRLDYSSQPDNINIAILDNRSITKVEMVKDFLETLNRYKARGVLSKFLHKEWVEELNKTFQDTFESFKVLSNSLEGFSRYLVGWSLVARRASRPIHQEIKSLPSECYALLYSFHKKSIIDVSSEEYEMIIRAVERLETPLHKIVDAYNSLSTSKRWLLLFKPEYVETFLKNYLAMEEEEWERILPLLKPGLFTIGEFILKKAPELYKREEKVNSEYQYILSEWKRDLKDFQLSALMNFGYNERVRKELHDKYELGIEIKRF